MQDITADESAAAPPPSVFWPAATEGVIMGNMDTVHLSWLLGADIGDAESNVLTLDGDTADLSLHGSGFTYDGDDQLVGGAVNAMVYVASGGAFIAQLVTPSISAAPFGQWVATDATQTAFATILGGADKIDGAPDRADLIRTYAGNDMISGRGGADTIFGGLGNDAIYAVSHPNDLGPGMAGSTYLRGDEGDDYILGAAGFDDINGNMGADTGVGGLGDDWVVGGKDNDQLFGEDGDDIVYGNIGYDTCEGGVGNDIVRGGQNDDVVNGGDGADWLSGDRGSDTITGGSGHDVFHTFGDAGVDRVLDFGTGDKVQVDPGTQYTVSQVGADIVIDMVGGGQMILVGVAMDSLGRNWIFGA